MSNASSMAREASVSAGLDASSECSWNSFISCSSVIISLSWRSACSLLDKGSNAIQCLSGVRESTPVPDPVRILVALKNQAVRRLANIANSAIPKIIVMAPTTRPPDVTG